MHDIKHDSVVYGLVIDPLDSHLHPMVSSTVAIYQTGLNKETTNPELSGVVELSAPSPWKSRTRKVIFKFSLVCLFSLAWGKLAVASGEKFCKKGKAFLFLSLPLLSGPA